jgi:uncharacterized membrane protein
LVHAEEKRAGFGAQFYLRHLARGSKHISFTPVYAGAQPGSTPQAAHNVFLSAVAGAILVLVALRVALFWVKPFWLDETYTGASVYFESLSSLFSNWIKPDVHPPLYPMLLLFWSKIFGASDFALRVPSLIFGAGAIGVPYFGLRDIIGRQAAAIAALVLAVAPNAIVYSVEARPYGLVLLLAALATVFAIRYALTRRQNAIVAFTLVAVLLSLTHYFGLLLCCGLYLWLILRDWRNARALVFPCLFFAVALIPWLAYHLPSLLSKGGGNFWIPRHSLTGDIYISLTGAWGEDLSPNAFVFELIVPIVAALVMRRREVSRSRLAAEMLALTLIELTVVVVVSHSSPLTVSRYFIVFTPIAAVIAGILVGQVSLSLCLTYALALPFVVTLPWADSYLRSNMSQTIAWEKPAQLLMKQQAATLVFLLDDPLNVHCSDYQLRRLGEFFFRRAGSNIKVVPVSLNSLSLETDVARAITSGARPLAVLKPTTPIGSYQNHDAFLTRLARSYGGDCSTIERGETCIFR